MKHIYIGIDFSLKSPAICIFKDNQYKWLSYCTKSIKPKKDIITQEQIVKLSDVDMAFQDNILEGNDYSSSHWADIQNYRAIAITMRTMIFKYLGPINFNDYTFHFAFEGYSFNSFSNSNNIIDIVGATTTFKNILIDAFSHRNFTLDIVSPVTLKQTAGYSKWDKVDLFDVFIGDYSYIKEKWSSYIQTDYEKKINKGKTSVFKWDYHDPLLSGPFYSFCCNLDINRSVKKPHVPKPIDDMIDAYFICCWIRSKYLNAEG